MAGGEKAERPASEESTMDDILRSIRSILDAGEATKDRADFTLPESAQPANDDGSSGAPPAPPSGPPLAFLRRSRTDGSPAREAASVEAAGTAETRLSLEERLRKHREKAEAEKIALRRLTARAAAKERASERTGDKIAAGSVPTAEVVQPNDAREMIDEFEQAFAASDDLFEPVVLPDIEHASTSYAPSAQADAPLPPSQALVNAVSASDVAKALLEERGGEVNEAMAGMLRVMVRDWLDDNLSTVVERVVREEIERVSRARR